MLCNQVIAHIFMLMKTRRDPFQAIADPTRRAILCLIALQAMTPHAIADHFNSSRQAVSKHIQILSECSMVQSKQKGREIFYRVNVLRMKEIADWIEPFRQIWEKRFNQLDELLVRINPK